MAKYRNDNFKSVLSITRAMADETRLRVLMALAKRPLCLCQIAELFGLAASTMSKHMSILQQAELVNGCKKGRWMHFALAGDDSPKAVKQALAWAARSLEGDGRIAADRKRLRKVLKIEPAELCRRACKNKKQSSRQSGLTDKNFTSQKKDEV
jgi:DNA-binding transcriptional ArsR family regulator